MARNKHIGSDFDQFLREQGLLDDVTALALKRTIVWQLERFMADANLSKADLAARLGTSRSQLDRLLDSRTSGMTLQSLSRVADALRLGVSVVLEPRVTYATKTRAARRSTQDAAKSKGRGAARRTAGGRG
jgi:DNA-binding Xre family transcriptional regulator